MDNKKKKTILSVIAFSTIVLTMGILVIATFQGQSKTPQAGPKETTTSRAFYPLEPVPAPPFLLYRPILNPKKKMMVAVKSASM